MRRSKTQYFFVEEVVAVDDVVVRRGGGGLLFCCSAAAAKEGGDEVVMRWWREVDGVVMVGASGWGHPTAAGDFGAWRGGGVDRECRAHPRVRRHRVESGDDGVARGEAEQLVAGRRGTIALVGGAVRRAGRGAQGYREALRAHGIEPKAGWIISGGFMENDGYQAMKRLLESRARIDAVFAANDPAAIGAMKAVWDAGLSVPDDIAIVGAGNVVHSDLLRVPLTTVSWSKEEMGRRAAELILDQIGPHPKGSIPPGHRCPRVNRARILRQSRNKPLTPHAPDGSAMR